MNATSAFASAARSFSPAHAIALSAGFIAGAAGTLGFSPLAVPAVAAAWLLSMNGACFTLVGVLAGTLVSSSLASFSSAALFGGAQLLLALICPARDRLRALLRTFAVGTLAQALLLPFIMPAWGEAFVTGFACLLFSPAAAAVIMRASRALCAFMEGKKLVRTDAATLGMLAALFFLSLLLTSPAAGAAGLVALTASVLCALRSRALAAGELERTRKKLKSSAVIARGIARYIDTSADGDALAALQLDGVGSAMEALAKPFDALSPRLSMTFGQAGLRMDGSDVSGDSFVVRRHGNVALAVLSDGMGSGEAARRESANAARLFADMLAMGYGDAAADCLNRLLMLDDDEMYATLDAAIVDLAACEARLVKFGAPPSYLLREGKVKPIETPALPAGIIHSARAGECAVALHRGDVLILMTDGLADALGMELIASVVELAGGASTARDAADALLERARSRGFADDMSVVVLRFGAA